MEQTLNAHVVAPSGFFATLRHKIRGSLANRQHRRDIKRLSELPDYLLRDIGCEDLIRYPTGPDPHGF